MTEPGHTTPWSVDLFKSKRFDKAVDQFGRSTHRVQGVQSNDEAEFNNRMMDRSAEMFRLLDQAKRYAPAGLKKQINFVLRGIQGEW